MTPTRRLVLIGAVIALVAACAGCQRTARVTFIPEGDAYEAADLDTALAGADLGSAENIAPAEVLAARQEALADLRTYGEDAGQLADTLTSEFPVDVAAVPVVIEDCEYEGRASWLVIEAWGDTDAPLTHRRLWVFSRDAHEVLAAKSLR